MFGVGGKSKISQFFSREMPVPESKIKLILKTSTGRADKEQLADSAQGGATTAKSEKKKWQL